MQVTGITLLISFVVFLVNDARVLRSSKVKQLTALAEVLASNSALAISLHQQDAAERLLASLRSHSTIQYASLLDNDNEEFAVYRCEGSKSTATPKPGPLGAEFTDDGFLTIRLPVVEDGERTGSLFLYASMEDVTSQIYGNIRIAIVMLLFSLIVAVAFSLRLQRRICRPILGLATKAQQISEQGDLSVRLEKHFDDEIGVLYDQFNGMLQRIQDANIRLGDAPKQLRRINNELEQRVQDRTEDLSKANDQLKIEIFEREKAHGELQQAQSQLVETSRQAGMAELANGVLHNVGNVLNSVNVSACLVADKIRTLRVDGLLKAVELIQSHASDLGTFFGQHEKGKRLPSYLARLAHHIADYRDDTLSEVIELAKNVDHMKQIVRAQQSYSGVISGVIERCDVIELLEDAVRFVHAQIHHTINIQREYENVPLVDVERAKLLQILVNLVKNGVEAVLEHDSDNRTITLRVRVDEGNRLRIEVADNGIGIPADKVTAIFSHGFTTKTEGHGFGLHASAISATEMHGSLSVFSDGIGRGATFVVDLPAEVATAPI
ncbi:MAG: HAMP domain-containing protein [Planctomycetes bacterium]|nr:HAMP domain-containing protein [Planctomycetota bacterium]